MIRIVLPSLLAAIGCAGCFGPFAREAQKPQETLPPGIVAPANAKDSPFKNAELWKQAGTQNGEAVDPLSLLMSNPENGQDEKADDGKGENDSAPPRVAESRQRSFYLEVDGVTPATGPRAEAEEARFRRLQELYRAPSLAGLPLLARTVRAPLDGLSPLAAAALGRMHDCREAETLLVEATEHARPVVRQAALAGLLEMNSPRAREICRYRAREDTNKNVRLTAVLGLGLLQDQPSAAMMEAYLTTQDPGFALVAAWGLARMDEPAGFDHLHKLALAREPGVALRAMAVLHRLHEPRSLRVLFNCLFDRHDRIKQGALEIIDSFDEETVDEVLRQIPNDRAVLMRQRRQVIHAIQGKAEFPELYRHLITSGDYEDRYLGVLAVAKTNPPDAVELLVPAVADSQARVRHATQQALEQQIERLGLAPAPKERDSVTAWRKWWFRQHELLDTRPGKALVRLPDGRKAAMRNSAHLAWGAKVVKIIPGNADLVGASVTVHLRGLPYVILPAAR